ncbi:hypothetical protein PMAYCL1PPCAC_01541, partial [Pristionchus mayeri]
VEFKDEPIDEFAYIKQEEPIADIFCPSTENSRPLDKTTPTINSDNPSKEIGNFPVLDEIEGRGEVVSQCGSKRVHSPSLNENEGEKRQRTGENENSPNESIPVIEHIEHPTEEYSVCESLTWKARPAFRLICSYLRTNEDCPDLANFSLVSKLFRK